VKPKPVEAFPNRPLVYTIIIVLLVLSLYQYIISAVEILLCSVTSCKQVAAAEKKSKMEGKNNGSCGD